MQGNSFCCRRLGSFPAIVEVCFNRWLDLSSFNFISERGKRSECLLLALLRLLENRDLMSLPDDGFVDVVRYCRQLFIDECLEVFVAFLDFLLDVRFKLVIFSNLFGKRLLVLIQRSELEHHLFQHRLQSRIFAGLRTGLFDG